MHTPPTRAGRLHFAIHPFHFRLAPDHVDAEVTLNWENSEARWVAPGTLRGLPGGTVPLLAETWERLHLSAGQAAALRRLAEDRAHGAAQLAAWAVEELGLEAAARARAGGGGGGEEPEGAGAAALAGLRNFGYHLAACRPSMAPIANSVAAVLAEADEQLQARCGLARGAWSAPSRRFGLHLPPELPRELLKLCFYRHAYQG